MRDLRRAPRVPVSHMVVGLISGHRLVHGDISLTGIGFELATPTHLRPSDVLEVRLYLPDQMVLVRVMVTRIRRAEPRSVGKMFVGCEIIGMDELVFNPLFRFVEEAALLRCSVPAARPTSQL